MGFLFFKSKKEKERAERRKKRHALRKAEGAIDEVAERIKRMEKDAEAEWGRAREAAKEGKQAAAQRALTSYRSAQVLITKLEQKKWVFKQVLMKLETAGTDAEFANALAAVRRAYRLAAKKCHPDILRASGASEGRVAAATEQMAQINDAWDTIRKARGM